MNAEPPSVAKPEKTFYDYVERPARWVKSGLQMAIGVVAVVWTTVDYFSTHPSRSRGPSLLIGDITVGLAAAVVIEVAYTLFTRGPDEALDPLVLGVSSAMLLQVASIRPHFEPVLVLFLETVVLGALLPIRLFLVNSEREPLPWWIHSGPAALGDSPKARQE